MTDEKQKTRFNQFIKSIEWINPKTLSIRLKEMKEMGVIEKSFSKWNTYQNRILSYRRKTCFATNCRYDDSLFNEIL